MAEPTDQRAEEAGLDSADQSCNPYERREVTGVADTVLSRGRVIIDSGTFVGPAGAGAFLKRSAH